jgi:hypothetical protein
MISFQDDEDRTNEMCRISQPDLLKTTADEKEFSFEEPAIEATIVRGDKSITEEEKSLINALSSFNSKKLSPKEPSTL